jgi:hypothetical protein
MAPGPRVHVYENLTALETSREHEIDDDDDEDDGPTQKYYKSNKVLGKLFRGIDEIAFLDELQNSIRPSNPNALNVLLSLWAYVEHETTLLVWNHQLNDARDIKEM